MLKKGLITVFCLIQMAAVNAATNVKVVATEDFNTESPKTTFDVKIMDRVVLGEYDLGVNSVLHCEVVKVVDQKRGKRNAKFYVKPVSYIQDNVTIQIEEEMLGRYSKKVLSKEELKHLEPVEVAEKAALTVGNHFVKGLSIGVSFVKGVVKNEEDNRLKSGVTKAYKESPLSYISEGEPIDIKVGDEFYLVFKIKDDNEPNYTYTEAE